MFKFIRTTLIALCMLGAIVGCSKPEDQLIGKWRDIKDGSTAEFIKDGTVIVHQSGMTVTGRYSVLEKNRLKLEFEGLFGLGGPQISDFKFENNKLLTSNKTGGWDTAVRVTDTASSGKG